MVITPEIVQFMRETLDDIIDVGFRVPYTCHKCGTVNPVISEVCRGCHHDVSLHGNPLGADHPVALYYAKDHDAVAAQKFLDYVKGLIAHEQLPDADADTSG